MKMRFAIQIGLAFPTNQKTALTIIPWTINFSVNETKTRISLDPIFDPTTNLPSFFKSLSEKTLLFDFWIAMNFLNKKYYTKFWEDMVVFFQKLISLVRGSSINEVTTLGVKSFVKVFVIKSVTMAGKKFKKYPKLRDVIYGQPLIWVIETLTFFISKMQSSKKIRQKCSKREGMEEQLLKFEYTYYFQLVCSTTECPQKAFF
jgi:hypothetical protein